MPDSGRPKSALPQAELQWQDGVPSAATYGDIYFNPDDGLAETRHVFLDGNDLPDAWQSRDRFVIGELGFGSGLNLLATWDLWEETAPHGARLDFLSIEGAPFSVDQLEQAHQAWPQFAELSQRLRDVYPPHARGQHVCKLSPNITLHLLFGDIAERLPQIDAAADAWFLDGFAPTKNPDMWSDDVFREMARCSAPGATASTFTVAGDVRRGLQAAGYEIEKTPGYGRKREMLRASLTQQEPQRPATPWASRPKPRPAETIAIIGAGIAGLCAAYALKQVGKEVCIIDADDAPAQGGSGTPSGLVMPRVGAGDDPAARFYASALRKAAALYTKAGAITHGGGLRLGPESSDQSRLEKMVSTGLYSLDEVSLLSQEDAAHQAGIMVKGPALRASEAGALDIQSFAQFALEGVDTHFGKSISEIKKRDDCWVLTDQDDVEIVSADHVIIAGGAGSSALLPECRLPLAAQQGQVVRIRGLLPAMPISFGGYVAPTDNGAWVGSTHEPLEQGAAAQVSQSATDQILAKLGKVMEVNPGTLTVEESWVGLRATTPDRLPLAGPVCHADPFNEAFAPLSNGVMRDLPPAPFVPGMWVISGLGSRGFVTAPLLGEIIAAQIADAPLPCEKAFLDTLSPMRFHARGLKRGKPL